MMDNLFQKLKGEFPSLSDDDAVKASAQLREQTQPAVAPQQPVIDPGNDSVDIQAVPEPVAAAPSIPSMEDFRASSQPAYTGADIRSGMQTVSKPDAFGDEMKKIGWMQYFPRLQGIYKARMDAIQGQLAWQQAEAQRVQNQKNTDRKFLEIDRPTLEISQAEAARKARDDAKLQEIMKNPKYAAALMVSLKQRNKGYTKAEALNAINELTPEERYAFYGQTWEPDKALITQETSLAGNRSAERIKQMDIDAEKAKEQRKGPALTPGQQKADENFSKTANEWNAGGYSNVASNIKMLDGVLADLKADVKAGRGDGMISSIGGTISKAPFGIGTALNPEKAATRQRIGGVVAQSLKETFGGNISDGEREFIVNTSYDPALSPSENASRLEINLEKIKRGAAIKDRMVKHFSDTGTVSTFDNQAQRKIVEELLSSNTPGNEKGPAGMTRVQTPDGTIKNVPNDKLEWALDPKGGGGKVVK